MAMTWADLAATGGITLAVDTESEGPRTLTLQFAVRVGDEVRVQVYHVASVPPLKPPWFAGEFGRPFRRWVRRVTVLPPKPVTPDLSPARVVADLFGLPGGGYLSRTEGAELAAAGAGAGNPGGRPKSCRSGETTGGLDVRLVGHFLRADLVRAFGQEFWTALLLPRDGGPTGVAVRESKVIGLTGPGRERFEPVAVEYVRDGQTTMPIRMVTFDTCIAYGPGTLDDLAESFLGVAKVGGLAAADKAVMESVFTARPKLAYQYAATDVVLTLLLAEQMTAMHADVYRQLGFADQDIPRCHATPGLRVANLLLRDVARTAAAGAADLGGAQAGRPAGPASLRALKRLSAHGGAAAVGNPRASRFGAQTGQTHGGLLFSRTPTRLFHDAPGRFRDVDLASCYPSILAKMNVYVGRPVIFEPGAAAPTLREAVELLTRNAAGRDAWFVTVSGPLSAAPNALIPSANDALTHENYRKTAARALSKASPERWRTAGGESPRNGTGNTSLFTDEVAAGVVVWATWQMIQAMPPAVRTQYERLRVESLVFYPKAFVADDGAAFDALRERLRTGADVGWTQRLDLAARRLVTVDDLDESYATLRYPVGRLAARLVELRKEARLQTGRGSGTDRALKLLANTVYGALCSAHLPTQNVVAAQVVTGTARAAAFGMAMALNVHNVVTDGGLYRTDQIPAGRFADCLDAHPDYPIRRPETGLRFVDPAKVPTDDKAFTKWYRGHVRRFFGVSGKSYDFLFGLHRLEHKRLPKTDAVGFDAVCIDGAANYAKLVAADEGGWAVAEFKARSFRPADKAALGDWLVGVCSADHYAGPPPAVESVRLLTVREAMTTCRDALGDRPRRRACLPVGMARPRVLTYKVIKPSQFLFRTAAQKRRVTAEWKALEAGTACGPEVLALRRTFGGSVAAVAQALYDLIRAGKNRLNGLNTARVLREDDGPGPTHAREVAARRHDLDEWFATSLLIRRPAEAPPTGLVVTCAEAAQLCLA